VDRSVEYVQEVESLGIDGQASSCKAARTLQGVSLWFVTCRILCRDSQMGLTLDPQLVRDLTVLITSSTVGGMVLEALKQPVINGYFLAGSVVGPGGFKLIKVRQS